MTDLATATAPASATDHDRPLTVGSRRLRDLIAQIGEGTLERERSDQPPYAQFDLIKAAKLGALRIPQEHGGGGASTTDLYATVIDLAEADPNVPHSLRNHFQITESMRRRPHPSHERYWDLVRDGQLFGLSVTELTSKRVGARQRQLATAVTETPDGLRLNGVKFYSTGNLYVDQLLVVAQGDEEKPLRLIVPVERPGVIREDDWDGIGQRFTGSGTTRFVDVPVTPDDFVENALAYEQIPYLSTFAQLFLTAIIAGILRTVTTDAAAYLRTRTRSFYHAASEVPAEDAIFQERVGEISATAYAGEAMVMAAAAALQDAIEAHGQPEEEQLALRASLRAAKAKLVLDTLALDAATKLFDLGGGSTTRRSNQLDRHWRNIRTLASHNPRALKAKVIGDYEISGNQPPNGSFF
jgi:alkylation response protein AidB-like acyl-CoA dehydrogenase